MLRSLVIFCTFVFAISNVAVASDDYSEKAKELVKFMRLPDTVSLTSVGQDGWPNTRAMINLRNPKYVQKDFFANDSFETIFLTGKSTRKVQQFLLNNKAGVYYYTPSINTKTVFVTGYIEIIEDPKEMKKYFDDDNFKQLPSAAKEGEMYILKFKPLRVKSYYRGELSSFDVQ